MKTALIVAGIALIVPGLATAQTADAPAAAVDAHYTLDTPIKILIADAAAKAVLDKDLPGMSSDDNLPKFEDKSLRQLQPLTGGQLTDDLLKQVATDLAALAGGTQSSAEEPTSAAEVLAPSDATPAKPVGSTVPTEGR